MKSFFFWLAQEVNAFTWIVVIGLDFLWNLIDLPSIGSVIGILCYPVVMAGIFILTFPIITLIQHFLSDDEWGIALKKGAILAGLTALPFSFVTVIAGVIGAATRQSRGGDYTAAFGQLGLNYRELEKTIKAAARSTGWLNGNWQEVTMETAVNTLERAGKISRQEASELHQLRVTRNMAHHEETPTNLVGWVDQSARLLQKYRERFGTV